MNYARFASLGTIRRVGTFVLPAVLGICFFLVYVVVPLAAVSCGSEPREDRIRVGEARGPEAAPAGSPHTPPDEGGGPPREATRADAPEIVTLRTRQGFIEVRADRSFTLLHPDGRVLAPNLTEKDLRARFPGYWQTLEHGFASPGPVLDASGPAEWFLDSSERVRFPPLREVRRESHAR